MSLILRDERTTGSRQAVWACESIRPARVQCLGVWTEKRPGLGEDAEPTLLLRRSTRTGSIGVYDGLGGAGARSLGHSRDGRSISSAFAASRLAHLAVREWFVEGRDKKVPLEGRLREVFDGARPPGVLKVRGTMTKQLPTTIAMIDFEPGERGGFRATARWAGDSRCYLLSPGLGLQQLSVDDSDENDPLLTLLADQPLTNQLAAGFPFQLHEQVVDRPAAGCMLLCATDGFFGYVASPAMFEYHLLRALAQAGNPHDWGGRLADWRHGTSGDDASLALVALGFDDFRGLRDGFRDRLDRLHREHADPLRRLEEADLDEAERDRRLDDFREGSWARYRETYMELMPGRVK